MAKTIVFGCILSLIIISILFILYYIRQLNNDNVCQTSYCNQIAKDILMSMNQSVDPCENFYEFTCGSWIHHTKLSNHHNYRSSSGMINNNMYKAIINVLSSTKAFTQSKSINNARRLYATCIDEYAIENSNFDLVSYLFNKTQLKIDLMDLLLKFNRYNIFAFYEVESMIYNDKFEKLKYIIRISPGNYYSKIIDKNNVSDFQIIFTTVKNLSLTINTSFDFSKYIRHLYYQLGNITIQDTDVVGITNLNRIQHIASSLNQHSLDSLQIYLIKYFISLHAFHLPKQYQTNFYANKSRRIACAKFVNKQMPFAVSKLYVDQYYDKITHEKSIEMIDNIHKTFIHMTDQSRIKTIEKKIGYPDYFNEKKFTQLDKLYAEYNFHEIHTKNLLTLFQLKSKERLENLYEIPTQKQWIRISPTTTNAFYGVSLNQIIVPAAFLQPPKFHRDAPKYLNYGAMGSIIGHELAHAFDTNQSKCLIDQYNNYKLSQINLSINGVQTLDENLADNIGLKIAFYAYKNESVEKKLVGLENYSNEQMFFISFGYSRCWKMSDRFARQMINSETHSPSEFRVQGSISNFAEFDRVFHCYKKPIACQERYSSFSK